MLLMGMKSNFTTYPIPPMMANPNAHDWAIFLNSILNHQITCNVWLLAYLQKSVWLVCEFLYCCNSVFDLFVHSYFFRFKLIYLLYKKTWNSSFLLILLLSYSAFIRPLNLSFSTFLYHFTKNTFINWFLYVFWH